MEPEQSVWVRKELLLKLERVNMVWHLQLPLHYLAWCFCPLGPGGL